MCGARGGFLLRHDEDLREPLVRRQGASERRGILWRWRGPSGLRWVWRNGRGPHLEGRHTHTHILLLMEIQEEKRMNGVKKIGKNEGT